LTKSYFYLYALIAVLSVCKPFDELTDGLKEGITVVYGPQASGKSTFCIMAAHSCAMEGKEVAYITKEKISFERVRQICGEDFDRVLKNLHLSFPKTIDGLERAVKNSRKLPNLGLLIIDPVNEHYWIEEERRDCFIRILSTTSMMCKNLHIPAILTASTYEKRGKFEPFGFRYLKETAKLMVELRVAGRRREIVIKGKENDLKREFVIGSGGLE